MTTTEYAKRAGCTRRTVLRAIHDGLIPAKAVRWTGRGKRRSVDIIDPGLAARSWVPQARFPLVSAAFVPPPSEGHDADEAWFKDVMEQERIASTMCGWGIMLGLVARSVMDIPRLATKRIGLTAGAAEVLRGLCADGLAVILPEGEDLARAVVSYIADSAESNIVEELIRTRQGAKRVVAS